MNKHRMTSEDEAALSGFELVYANVDLTSLKPNGELKKYKGKAGVYFWVMTCPPSAPLRQGAVFT